MKNNKQIFILSVFLFALIFLLPFMGDRFDDFYMLRLSRNLMAFFVGAGLCLITYALQNLTRNPLASEYTLGISASASFFAALGLLFDLPPVLLSIIGGLLCTFLIFAFIQKKVNGSSIILLGITLNIVFASGISFLNYLTGFKVSQHLSRWIFGGFSITPYLELILIAINAIILLIVIWISSPKLILISISSSYEEILGKAFKKSYFLILFLSGLFISLSISFCGPIPFFALLFVNFTRFALKGDPLKSILYTFFAGGFILAFLDSFSLIFSSTEEIPIGILTGISGLPFLVFFFAKEKT